MYLSNRAGLLGVVLAVILGYQVDGHVPANRPGLETLGISVGTLFLGLYGLTYDRCEVRGFVASYRANLQNVIAAMADSWGASYDKEVVPGRRLAIFVIPVAFAPIPMFLLCLLDVAIRLNTHGTLTRAERFELLQVPVAFLGIWWAHALATRSLRRRVNPATHESVHFGV